MALESRTNTRKGTIKDATIKATVGINPVMVSETRTAVKRQPVNLPKLEEPQAKLTNIKLDTVPIKQVVSEPYEPSTDKEAVSLPANILQKPVILEDKVNPVLSQPKATESPTTVLTNVRTGIEKQRDTIITTKATPITRSQPESVVLSRTPEVLDLTGSQETVPQSTGKGWLVLIGVFVGAIVIGFLFRK